MCVSLCEYTCVQLLVEATGPLELESGSYKLSDMGAGAVLRASGRAVLSS